VYNTFHLLLGLTNTWNLSGATNTWKKDLKQETWTMGLQLQLGKTVAAAQDRVMLHWAWQRMGQVSSVQRQYTLCNILTNHSLCSCISISTVGYGRNFTM